MYLSRFLIHRVGWVQVCGLNFSSVAVLSVIILFEGLIEEGDKIAQFRGRIG